MVALVVWWASASTPGHGRAQLRYQLNAKHTDLRVWRYWRTLNLLGTLDPDPDPIVRDNIMFSAFLGDVLNMFEAATATTASTGPGRCLRVVWSDGREFRYDHHSIIEAVHANYERSDLGATGQRWPERPLAAGSSALGAT